VPIDTRPTYCYKVENSRNFAIRPTCDKHIQGGDDVPWDIVPIRKDGSPTGAGLTLQLEEYRTLRLWELPSEQFPLLTRVSDYYDDAVFEKTELPLLLIELRRLKDLRPGAAKACIENLIRLVGGSREEGFAVEVIAD
jgi:hypothetical protein